MIQMRWFSTPNKPRVLQYRQKYDTTVRAGMFSPLEELKTAKYEWSDWMDVPDVHNDSVKSTWK